MLIIIIQYNTFAIISYFSIVIGLDEFTFNLISNALSCLFAFWFIKIIVIIIIKKKLGNIISPCYLAETIFVVIKKWQCKFQTRNGPDADEFTNNKIFLKKKI